MEKLIETTLSAINLASKEYEPGKPVFGECSSIFLAPTGNVKDMMEAFKNAKRVLAVGGAGAFGMEALYNDAEKVDMFDNNLLQKYYCEMVTAGMTIFTYEEFVKYFTLKSQGYEMSRDMFRDLVSKEMFEKVRILMSLEAQFVYENLYERFDSVDLIWSSLYRYEYIIYTEYLKKFASMYDEERYYKIQSILRSRSAEVTYSTVDLLDLPSKFEGPYDLIVLGNIPQYYKDIPGISTPYDFNQFIHKRLSKLLADDGVIQVNYGFKTSTLALRKHLNPSYHLRRSPLGPFRDEAIKNETKNGINIPLVSKWGYDYNFIPGVEPGVDGNYENMYITYRKKK